MNAYQIALEYNNPRVAEVLKEYFPNTEKKCCDTLKEKCTVLSITGIKYDNPILNHPEILKTLTNNLSRNLSFSEVVDRVNSFDREFVEEVCLSGNIELLQECFELS